MIVRKPSSQFTTSASVTTTSNTADSSARSSFDAGSCKSDSLFTTSVLNVSADVDHKIDIMSAEDYIPSKSLSVAIPTKATSISGPFCPRRPNLREILSNTSPPPWTLAAFMAYLSSNHCLETLEFTMDAGRYKKHYQKMMSRASVDGAPPSKDQEYVLQLWVRLIEAYIQPNGSREVNLPSKVRDPILKCPINSMPPAPEMLDQAVDKIYELMEDSVLVPFLNSVYPQTVHPTVSSLPTNGIDGLASNVTPSQEHTPRRHQRQARSSPPPQTAAIQPHAHSYSHPTFLNRKSAPSTFTVTEQKQQQHHHQSSKFSSRNSVKYPTVTSQPVKQVQSAGASLGSGSDLNLLAGSASNGMTSLTDDNSTSTGSPTGDSPLTPPFSPPYPGSSELGDSPASSPRTSRDSGMWRKLGRLSGMKMNKKKSQGGFPEQ